MASDYSIIGSFSYQSRFTPIERVPSETFNTIDESESLRNMDETDIDFIESLYRNSNPDYYLGAWIVRAVVNVVLEFTIGKLPRVNGNDDRFSKFCNKMWLANSSKLYAAFRELGLFGQEWIYIGYDNQLKLPKYRQLCRRNIVDIRYEDFNNPDDITYVRIRDTFTEFQNTSRSEIDNDFKSDEVSVIYDKIFWKEINPDYVDEFTDTDVSKTKSRRKKDKDVNTSDQWIHYMMILKRVGDGDWEDFRGRRINPMGVIPLIELNQDRLSIDKAGYSDVSGALRIAGIYHQVLERATDNNLYNMQPTLKFTGIAGDPVDFVKKMYGTDISSGDVIADNGLYDTYGSYYLPTGMDASWMNTPDHTGSSDNLLKLLFYILVQVTGVPEWALGVGMTGAWATVKQQAIPLLQKVHAKRMDVNDDLLKLCVISLKVMKFHNPNENYDFDTDAELVWDDVFSREITEVLAIIDSLLPQELITKETALSLTGVVSDPIKELETIANAKKEADKNKKDIEDHATEQINGKIIDLFRRQQKDLSLVDDEELKAAAGEMATWSDDTIIKVLNSMFDSNQFD